MGALLGSSCAAFLQQEAHLLAIIRRLAHLLPTGRPSRDDHAVGRGSQP